MAIFSDRLKYVLNQRHISQKELAEMADTTGATISRYLSDDRVPNAEFVTKIASALNISSDYLLGLTDDPTPPNKEIEPPPEVGTAEWLRQGLVKRGVIEDGQDLTKEQVDYINKHLDSFMKNFLELVNKQKEK